MKKVGVLDIKCGNIGSVQHALRNIGVNAVTVDQVDQIAEMDSLILPGIGHFSDAMTKLFDKKFITPLLNHIQSNKPFLGICLGMQVLAESSEEGNSTGLGIFKQRISQLEIEDFSKYKVPHSGWNTLEILQDSPLLKDIKETDEFFFLHKYCWKSDTSETFAQTTYGQSFASVIGKEKCWGVQFHPEKSHQAGLKILQNFVEL